MTNKPKSNVRASDFIPIYGTLSYFRRNAEEVLTSTKTALRDTALFFYNVALIIAVTQGLEKLIN